MGPTMAKGGGEMKLSIHQQACLEFLYMLEQLEAISRGWA